MRFLTRTLGFLSLTITVSISYSRGGEQIQLIGIGKFSGTASDLSRQTEHLENGTPHNRLGGFSALEYTGSGHRYVALPDRGPDDGATGYHCRFHLLDIVVNPKSATDMELKLVETILFHDTEQRPFSGASSVFVADRKVAGRLDPEGFRFGGNDNFYVCDEYGPHLIEFSRDGSEVRRLTLPERLACSSPAASKEEENRLNNCGRSSNKGMEGLAISADGQVLYGIMQHVLIQDGQRADNGKPIGINCRLVMVDVSSGDVHEYVYQLDAPENGLNEIVAIGESQFLVIERDGLAGSEAGFKKIMRIDLKDATDVQTVERLLAFDLPETIQPVSKEVFIDFLSPAYGLSAKLIPEKLEGLTLGEPLTDGRSTLVVSSDNDFDADTPSLIYVFALCDRDLSHVTANRE